MAVTKDSVVVVIGDERQAQYEKRILSYLKSNDTIENGLKVSDLSVKLNDIPLEILKEVLQKMYETKKIDVK